MMDAMAVDLVTQAEHIVSYADTDAGGIVYHGRFLDMAERARNKLFRAVGFTFSGLAQEHGVMLVVRRVEVSYTAPALLDDRLCLSTRLRVCQASRSLWVTDVARDGCLLASVVVEFVMVQIKTRHIARHPDALLRALAPYLVPDAVR